MIKKILSLRISDKELKFIDSPIGSIIIDCEDSPAQCRNIITNLGTITARAANAVLYNRVPSIEDGIDGSDKVTFFEVRYLWEEKNSVTLVPVSIRASLLETKTVTQLTSLAIQAGSIPEIYLDAFFCQSVSTYVPLSTTILYGTLIIDLMNFASAAAISLGNSPTSVATMKFFRSMLSEHILYKTMDFDNTEWKEFLKITSGRYICLKGFMDEKETYEEDQKILSLLESKDMTLISSNTPATRLESSEYFINNKIERLKNFWQKNQSK